LGADDSRSNRAGQTEGSSGSKDAVADLHGIAVAKLEVRQRFIRLDANDRQVILWITLDFGRSEYLILVILETHFHALGAGHDMIVRQNDPLGIDDKSRTEAVGRHLFKIALVQ